MNGANALIAVARKNANFSNRTSSFSPKTARYLELRVPETVAFHLKRVADR
jgi:hypothetical protein